MAMGSKHNVPFPRWLFFAMAVLIGLYLICFIIFQYNREKAYKIAEFNWTLQCFNYRITENGFDGTSLTQSIKQFTSKEIEAVRVTVSDSLGNVVFDSKGTMPKEEEAIVATTPIKGYLVHSSLPKAPTISQIMRPDRSFLWFMVIIALLMSGVIYLFSRSMGEDVDRLRLFAERADKGESIEDLGTFTSNELGEISNHIVRIYLELCKTKEALEKESHTVVRQEEEQVRLKRQLTQNINHELKTPVTSLQGYLETIIDNPTLSDEKKTDFILKSYEQVIRLSHLLRDIATVTRMDDASHMIEKEQLCLNEIVNEVFADAKARLAEKGIKAQIQMHQNISMMGNQSLLHSIFANLLDNALSYSGADTIILSIKRSGDNKINVLFADNGVGVAQEHLPRIFERFYRIDKGRSRKAGGTGLGLSIVKNAIIWHGGNVVARQNEPTGLMIVFSLRGNS